MTLFSPPSVGISTKGTKNKQKNVEATVGVCTPLSYPYLPLISLQNAGLKPRVGHILHELPIIVLTGEYLLDLQDLSPYSNYSSWYSSSFFPPTSSFRPSARERCRILAIRSPPPRNCPLRCTRNIARSFMGDRTRHRLLPLWRSPQDIPTHDAARQLGGKRLPFCPWHSISLWPIQLLGALERSNHRSKSKSLGKSFVAVTLHNLSASVNTSR